MAGKPIELNWTKINSYLQLKATKKTVAALVGVSEDTIERAIKREHQMTFSEYADKQLAPVRLKLVNKALSKALDGDNTLLIFCLKNLCGWKDKFENEHVAGDNTNLTIKIGAKDAAQGEDEKGQKEEG